uniref:Uncharacterized protein n=1 Tax=Loxodonta africana TaxID=9785 RepID=G3U0F3_LOXAF
SLCAWNSLDSSAGRPGFEIRSAPPFAASAPPRPSTAAGPASSLLSSRRVQHHL